MVQRNDAIAIIIIVLFVVLAVVGFAIYSRQNQVAFFSKRRAIDEESVEE